jgi:hypothetical protein
MKRDCAPEVWRQRYEVLREHALGGRDLLAAPPLGLHLLRCQGLAGWMERWTDATGSSMESGEMNSTPIPLPNGPAWQEQLTVLLAQMTFSHIRLGSPS